jgi:uroporphyrinogen-III decarboxylase
MSPRERIVAALKGQSIDRIPFVPLIGPYTVMEMPEEITGSAGGVGFDPQRMMTASRALGCDLMIRHVPATTPLGADVPHLSLLGRFGPPIEAKAGFEQGQLTETLTTPIGSVTGTWKFTDRVGIEEMMIFHYAVDHLNKEPVIVDEDAFLEIDRAIGDDGIATASMSNSPFMFLIEMAWGLENTYYLLNDHREEVEEILKKLHASLKRYVEVIADSPAQIIIQYENTSSTLLSPEMFRRYCLPYLNEYADILRDAGKIYLMHMCGKLHALVDDIGSGRFRGITDIASQPTGDLPLDEAAAKLPGKAVIGGIDPTVFISHDQEFVKSKISDLIKRIKPFKGVLLGSADVTPRGTPVENLRLIRTLVDKYGTYG